MKILNHPSFRFAYYECNGFDFAYNWEVFPTEIISEIWKNKHGGNSPFRPHFIIEGYKPIPTNPVALLIGNPITKFIAACHEDGYFFDPDPFNINFFGTWCEGWWHWMYEYYPDDWYERLPQTTTFTAIFTPDSL